MVPFSLKSAITAPKSPVDAGRPLLRAIVPERPQERFGHPSHLRIGAVWLDAPGRTVPASQCRNVAYGLRGLPTAELFCARCRGFRRLLLWPAEVDSSREGRRSERGAGPPLAPRPVFLLLMNRWRWIPCESLSIELREIITGEGITSIYVTTTRMRSTVADQIAGTVRLDSPEAVEFGDMVLRVFGSREGRTELAG